MSTDLYTVLLAVLPAGRRAALYSKANSSTLREGNIAYNYRISTTIRQ